MAGRIDVVWLRDREVMMQYALVEALRTEAFPGGIGSCANCGARMVAKCGSRILHHWAHHGRRDCDPWWENETKWHREWKNKFPSECREISHVAPDGEIHRADIKTPTGIYIEFQHSSMADQERRSREVFYQNLVWVIDGTSFRKNFDIYHMLPDPSSDLARDLVWAKAKRHLHGANNGGFWRISTNRECDPDVTKPTSRLVQIESLETIKTELQANYRGHHQYDWIRPHRTWIDTNFPVYIDFGEEWLVRLEVYDATGLKCIRKVSKQKFIHDAMIELKGTDIATRFSPIPSK